MARNSKLVTPAWPCFYSWRPAITHGDDATITLATIGFAPLQVLARVIKASLNVRCGWVNGVLSVVAGATTGALVEGSTAQLNDKQLIPVLFDGSVSAAYSFSIYNTHASEDLAEGDVEVEFWGDGIP